MARSASSRSTRERPAGTESRTTRRQPRGQGAAYVYERLRDKILRLELAPGTKIDETRIVEELQVSRTPVREALVWLSSDGLVTMLPNRGALVTPLDVMELAQYFEALELTHRAVQHWAAARRTSDDLDYIKTAMQAYEAASATKDPIAMSKTNIDFHEGIARAARNRFFETMVSQLAAQGMRLSWIWFDSFSRDDPHKDIDRTIKDHRTIFKAIESRDTEEAEHLATSHIEEFRERLYAQLSDSLGKAVSTIPG